MSVEEDTLSLLQPSGDDADILGGVDASELNILSSLLFLTLAVIDMSNAAGDGATPSPAHPSRFFAYR
jgi:hypothetical protein